MILGGALVILILVVLGVVLVIKKNNSNPATTSNTTYKPEFLNTAEKQALGLPDVAQVQAVERGANGELMVYKIIRSTSDIVTNPDKLGPISPRQK